jgi:hypothetical protein
MTNDEKPGKLMDALCNSSASLAATDSGVLDPVQKYNILKRSTNRVHAEGSSTSKGKSSKGI